MRDADVAVDEGRVDGVEVHTACDDPALVPRRRDDIINRVGKLEFSRNPLLLLQFPFAQKR